MRERQRHKPGSSRPADSAGIGMARCGDQIPMFVCEKGKIGGIYNVSTIKITRKLEKEPNGTWRNDKYSS